VGEPIVCKCLTPNTVSVDDIQGQVMNRKILFAVLVLDLACAFSSSAQDNPKSGTSSAETQAPAAINKLTIEVTGGEKNKAVENASVYLKYVEEKKLLKDRKYELNVKTNREGSAHIPDPPMGKVLIQIVADGWKTYGQYYELKEPGMVIKIHLDRPPKWY
jgi:hypothetical protein